MLFLSSGMVLEEFAWAAVEYGANGGDKDKDGTPVKYQLVFPNYHSPKELLALKSNGYDHKNLIKEVPDVVAVVKYEFYKDPANPNEGIMVVLYPDGRARSVKFKIKQVDGNPKYVFTDPKTPGAVVLKDHEIQIFQEENGAPWRHVNF